MKKLLKLLLTGGALLALVPQTSVRAQTPDPMPPHLQVSGEGIVRVQPDMAMMRFGVVTENEDPEEARRRNAEAAREAMNAVRALGVEERDIKLETLRLQPKQEYNPTLQRYEQKGFEAVREVVVTVRDLDKLPNLVAEVVQKGANRLLGVMYDLENRDEARNQALQEAIGSARGKAQLMASALGVELGRPRQVIEQNFDFPRPMMRLAMDMDASLSKEAAPEPEAYASGEIEVRATVMIMFEFK